MKLESISLVRDLPPLLGSADGALFEAERVKTLPEVETSVSSGEFFPVGWQEDFSGGRGRVRRLVASFTTRSRPFSPEPGKVPLVATDRFSNGYFHWVTETLARLWWVRNQLPSCTLVLPTFADRFGYMRQSLELFPELGHRTVPSGERWRLAKALVVPATAPTGNYRPDLVREVGAAWRAKVGAAEPYRKVYVSRSKATRRRIANEAVLLPRLQAAGWEIVHLEGLPFADQVRLLAETKELLSNHGAGLTNMLFMVPGTKVTEIRMAGDSHNNCYFSLARALGLDYSYRLGQPARTGDDVHSADLLVDVGGF